MIQMSKCFNDCWLRHAAMHSFFIFQGKINKFLKLAIEGKLSRAFSWEGKTALSSALVEDNTGNYDQG